MNSLRYLLFFVLGAFVLFGCSDSGRPGDMPMTLRVSVLPDETKEILLLRYNPLIDYLADELGISVELQLADDYSDLLKRFSLGQCDLAYFGGFTFIQAYEKYQAVPLVMRDIDTRFTSYFLVRSDNPDNEIAAFSGKTLAFGSTQSTSGHLMPRFYLQSIGINPDMFFGKILYSGSHDNTAYWVRDGKVDIGVANSKIIDDMLIDGRLNQNDIRIIQESTPYSDYVWALRTGFSEDFKFKIRNAFLSLVPDNEIHKEILNKMSAGGFYPASINDFIALRNIVHQHQALELAAK